MSKTGIVEMMRCSSTEVEKFFLLSLNLGDSPKQSTTPTYRNKNIKKLNQIKDLESSKVQYQQEVSRKNQMQNQIHEVERKIEDFDIQMIECT